jgi:hypothetical protein
MPVYPEFPGSSSRSTGCQPPLPAILALICSPLLNHFHHSSQTLFLSSALPDLLALLDQWAAISGAFLGFLTIQHRWRAVSFRLT